MKTTIDGEGRIALGRKIQIQRGVYPGDEVSLESRGDECVIKPTRTATGLGLKDNVLVHRTTAPASSETGLSNVRDERFQRLVEGLPQ